MPLQLSQQEFESRLAQSGLSKRDKIDALNEYHRLRVARSREEFVRNAGEVQGGAVAEGIGQAATGILNWMDTATLGYGPKIAAAAAAVPMALGDRTLRESYDDALGTAQGIMQAGREANPVTATAGSIAGYFAGPSASLASGAGRLLSAPARNAAQAVAQRIIGRGATKLAANVAGNVGAAAGAIGAMKMLESRDDDASIAQRASDAIAQFNPTTSAGLFNLGVSAAAGGVQTALSRAGDARVLAFEKKLQPFGYKASPDARRDSRFLQTIFDWTRRNPLTAKLADQFLDDDVYKPIRDWAASLTRGATTESAQGRAAGAVRRLAGTAAKDGGVALARKGPERAALASEGARVLSQESRAVITDTLASFAREAQAKGASMPARTAGLNKALRDVGKALEGDVTVEQANEFLQRFGRLGEFRNVLVPGDPDKAARTSREAKRLYHAWRVAIRQTAPAYSAALDDAAAIRGIEASLQGVGKNPTEMDRELLHRLFGAKKDFVPAWNGITKYADPQEVQALRGWYVARYIETVSSSEGAGSVPLGTLMDRVGKQRGGMFTPEVFDRVAPGVRAELREAGHLTDRLRKGIAKAEGSQTAGREMITKPVLAIAGIGTGYAIARDWIENPFTIGKAALGLAGLRVLAGSLLRGRLADKLNAMAEPGAQVPYLAPVRVQAAVAREPRQ